MKKRIWKTILIAAATIAVLLIGTVGFFYWKISSISLEDIQQRRTALVADQDGTAPASGGVGNQAELPSSLDGAVGKAEQIAGKTIETDDALDVAAILLNSGLSFREMYILLGQSDEELTTEEKQAIRNLLLAKLTTEEIDALRSITKQYGKYLAIVDTNYPIEAVGEKDDAKRKAILEKAKQAKEDEGKQAAEVDGQETASSQAGSAGKTDGAVKLDEPGKQSSGKADTATDNKTASQTKDNQSKTKSLDSKYESQLAALKGKCVSSANQLMTQVVAAINKSSELDEKALQGELLGKIAAAEASCDKQYQALINKAETEYKEAGIAFAKKSTWTQEYQSIKAEIRSSAINKLNAVQASG
ncbi:hypothetical protein SAMN04487969_11768 [Paenibacillus algorifonticola]|uniref:Uncharacterized protein n=1 Tax=Paenibacillus algorifonticola TaxID=684063 RepID=A0A1I2GRY1_9BACL|nr:hypothetical protein [Paenibacillus algorifonticola]SFF19436.1 hypothetical protein SAMN04487969_11768 [Paenibacillus algorifonticola]